MKADILVRQHVLDELDFNPSFDAEHIGVAVKDGIVTLSGYVSSYVQKAAIEEAIQRIPGVKAVAEDLVVRLPREHRLDDDEIARRVLNVLRWGVGMSSDVKVVVDNGKVTLRGETDWNFQKEAAARAIKALAGVVSVINGIVVRPKAKAADVAQTIRKAFERNADLDSAGIQIEIDGSRVVLSGTVRAWFERKIAEDAAWSIPGITTVTDNIAVADVM